VSLFEEPIGAAFGFAFFYAGSYDPGPGVSFFIPGR